MHIRSMCVCAIPLVLCEHENFPVLAGLLQAQLGAVEDSAAPSCTLKSWMSQHQLHAMQARDLGYSIQLPVN